MAATVCKTIVNVDIRDLKSLLSLTVEFISSYKEGGIIRRSPIYKGRIILFSECQLISAETAWIFKTRFRSIHVRIADVVDSVYILSLSSSDYCVRKESFVIHIEV